MPASETVDLTDRDRPTSTPRRARRAFPTTGLPVPSIERSSWLGESLQRPATVVAPRLADESSTATPGRRAVGRCPGHRRRACRSDVSGWVGLVAFRLLGLSDESDDGVDLLGREANDWGHVTEVPMVCSGATGDGEVEGLVGVMVGLINDRQEGRARSGAPEVVAMASGTVSRVELRAPLYQCPVLGWVGVSSRGAARHEQQGRRGNGARRPHDAGLRSRRRRSWALAATMTVEALIRTAAAAGARTNPAHARAPAARGMATTL